MTRGLILHRRILSRRDYIVLALESSCDDSCVALLEQIPGSSQPRLIAETRRTLNSGSVGGIIPTAAHDFHHANMANLVQEFLHTHGLSLRKPPDLICCTRGPGMVGSLSSSLQLAKGLLIAWKVPLIGVHHMLGHILAARLTQEATIPQYPFLSFLCSGGHTMLVLLKSTSEHEIIIDTADIAAGDALDKCARELGVKGNMVAQKLEIEVERIPINFIDEFRKVNLDTLNNDLRLKLPKPYRGPHDLRYPSKIEFSFSLFLSTLQGFFKRNAHVDQQAIDLLRFKVQESLFDHLVDRLNIALIKHGEPSPACPEADRKFANVKDFVCSGGVAANKVLRRKLQNNLAAPMNFHFPDFHLCTDNAAMIGIAGIEIFEKLRVTSDLSILPIRKWPLSDLLNVDGWLNVGDKEFSQIVSNLHDH